MYGGGWIGLDVEVVDRKFGGIKDILASSRTPRSLVGKKGKVIDALDDGYDTDRPTGYERITLVIEVSPNEEIQIDSACVKEVENTVKMEFPVPTEHRW